MKYTQKFLSWIVACSIAVAMVANVTAETLQTSVKVVRIKGSARYTMGRNVWQPLQVGTILKEGSIIQTANGSVVDLVIGEDSGASSGGSGGGMNAAQFEKYQPKAQRDIIRVWEDSVLGIDKLLATQTGADKVTDTQLDLRAGRIFFAVKKVSAASTFEIKIPNGVAGIRGTLGSLSALGVCGLFSGSAGLAFNSPSGPVTKIVEAGFQFDIRTGDFSRLTDLLSKELPGLLEQVRERIKETTNLPKNENETHVSAGTGQH